MFERVSSAKEYDGTGIGLAIVKKAVERMGGKLGVKSGYLFKLSPVGFFRCGAAADETVETVLESARFRIDQPRRSNSLRQRYPVNQIGGRFHLIWLISVCLQAQLELAIA